MFSSTDVAVRIVDIYPIAQREPLRPVPRATIRPLASEKPGSLLELDRSEAAIRRCEPEVRLVKSDNRVGLVRGVAAAAAPGAVDAKQLLTDEILTSKCRTNSVLSPVGRLGPSSEEKHLEHSNMPTSTYECTWPPDWAEPTR